MPDLYTAAHKLGDIVSAKRFKITSNWLWISLHFIKDIRYATENFIFRFKRCVMGSFFAGKLPQSLYGIKFWGVRWKIINLNPLSIFSKPVPNIAVLMIRSSILNVVNASTIFKKLAECRFQENHIGRGVEDFIEHKFKLRRMQVNAAKNLNWFTLSRHWNKWLATNSRPGSV